MDSESGAMTEDYVHELSSIDLDRDFEHLEEVVKQETAKIAAQAVVNGQQIPCVDVSANINNANNPANRQFHNHELQMRIVHGQHNGGLPGQRKQQIALAANTPNSPTGSPGNCSLPPSPEFAQVPGNTMSSPVMGQASVDPCCKGGLLDDSNGMPWLTAQLRYGSNGVIVGQDGPLDLRGQCGPELDGAWLSPNMRSRNEYIEMQTNRVNNGHINGGGMQTRLMHSLVNGNNLNNSIPNGVQQMQHHNNNNQIHHQQQNQLYPNHHHHHHHQNIQNSGQNLNQNSNINSNISNKNKNSNSQSNFPTSRDLLDDDQLVHLTVRELNRKLHGCPREEVVKMKQKRRTLKNRGYAQNCRTKRMAQRHELESKNRYLGAELQRNKEDYGKLRVDNDRLRVDYDRLRVEFDKICQERDFYRDQVQQYNMNNMNNMNRSSSQNVNTSMQLINPNQTSITNNHVGDQGSGSLSSVSSAAASSSPSSPEFYL